MHEGLQSHAGELAEGTLIAGRYRVGSLAGVGGMGSVYRAEDTATGAVVALKVTSGERVDRRRFDRETRLLSEIRHPSVVRYVDHGHDAVGAFLVMEWVSGPSLRDRLKEGPLSLAGVVQLGLRLAEGLGHLHAHGVLHRDLKPSNLLLTEGEASDAKLVDFGIARRHGEGLDDETALTQTGTVIGTVGYMSPEQVRGLRNVDERSDLFSLGCVLYQCLAALPPFASAQPGGALSKVLLEEPPALRELRPEVPAELSSLVERLLRKSASERPSSAAEVIEELRSLGELSSLLPEGAAELRRPLRSGERRLSTALLIGGAIEAPTAQLGPKARSGGDGAVDRERVLRELLPEGSVLSVRPDGATVVSFALEAGPAELASLVAQCALALKEALPGCPLVLISGRTSEDSQTLEPSTGSEPSTGTLLEAAQGLQPPGVLVDELSAALLASRFELREEGRSWRLLGELGTDQAPALRRRLLGRPVPCVGRRKELALLEATFEEVAEESVARAVLVMGPAGIGKSRLGAELQERLREQPLKLLIARATPMKQDAAGSVLRVLVRSAAKLSEAEGGAKGHQKLQRYLGELGMGEPELSAEIVGEVVALPSVDEPSVVLKAAREDPKVLRHWLGRVVPEWLLKESARQPLLLVLEDVHWADRASVELLDEALSKASNAPVLVLGLARPEVQERFRPLFRSLLVQEVPLAGLTAAAGRQMVVAALPETSSKVVEMLLERAQGNPFFLEELIRAVAAGRQELPDSVLALAEAHLQRLDPEARRVLRAASVLGPSFQASAAAHLLGDTLGSATLSMLEELVEAEVLERQRTRARELPQAADDLEYSFRHILLRDAAYAMLPEEERRSAHALAGSWLEERGDVEPGLLAEHWEQAGDRARASLQHLRAGTAALYRGDMHGTMRAAERGLALDPNDEIRGQQLFLLSMGQFWSGQFLEVRATFKQAADLLPERSPQWVHVLGRLSLAASFAGDPQSFGEAVERLGDPSLLEPCAEVGDALCAVGVAVLYAVGIEAAQPYLDALLELDRRVGDEQPVMRAWASFLQGTLAGGTDRGGLEFQSRHRALQHFEAVGEPMGIALTNACLSMEDALFGQLDDALHYGSIVSEEGKRAGFDFITSYAELGHATVLARTDPDEALVLLRKLGGSPVLDTRSFAAVIEGSLALRNGDLDEARNIADSFPPASITVVQALPDLLRGFVALGENDLDGAREHHARLARYPLSWPTIGALTHQLAIRVHLAVDEEGLAKEAARRAMARLHAIADALPETARERFWTLGFEVPETVKLIESVIGSE